MATGDNFVTPLFVHGNRSGKATGAITGGRFVKISATPDSGPLLNTANDGSTIKVAQCVAGNKAQGVAEHDAAAAGDRVGVLCIPGMVVPMQAGAAITFGQEVESDANGKPIPLNTGKANGVAENTAASGGIVYVRLYV